MRLRNRRHDRGTVQIEFVLAFIVLMFVIFWTWELVMAVYTYTVIADAAKEGVRYAIVHGTGNSNCSGPSTGCGDTTGVNVINVVTDYAKYSLHDISAMTVTVTYPDSSSDPPNRVRVTVAYTYVPWAVLPWTPPTMNAAAEGRIVN